MTVLLSRMLPVMIWNTNQTETVVDLLLCSEMRILHIIETSAKYGVICNYKLRKIQLFTKNNGFSHKNTTVCVWTEHERCIVEK